MPHLARTPDPVCLRNRDKDVYAYYRAQMRSQIWAKCFAQLSSAPRFGAPKWAKIRPMTRLTMWPIDWADVVY